MFKVVLRNFLSVSNPRLASDFGILLLIVGFFKGFMKYAYTIFINGGSGVTGDWLINYSSGFVRRGLLGSIFLYLSPHGSSGLWIMFLLQSVLYAFVFGYFILYLKQSKSDWFKTILVASPAGICLYGWNTDAFGRKEIIGYVTLILLARRVNNKNNHQSSKILLLLSYLFFTLGVFSWEPLALLTPFVVFLLAMGFTANQSIVERYLIQAIFVVTGIFGFFISIVHRGSVGQVVDICYAIRSKGLNGVGLCTNAVEAIGWSNSFALGMLQERFPLYIWYLPLFALALFPIIYSGILINLWKLTLIGFICLLPLYLIVDYGRWFSMFYVSLLVVLITMNQMKPRESQLFKRPVFGILFLTVWGIPYWASPDSNFPFVGALATALMIFRRLFVFSFL